MNDIAQIDAYATVTEANTLTIQRLLPAPVERVWAYLTDSDLRRRWLAAGEMKLEAGAPFAFTWRNDELTDPPGQRPEGMSVEHRMESRITEVWPPHHIAFTWDGTGDVSIDLEARGGSTLLTLVHRSIPARSTRLGVSAGWHAHLDVLADRVEDRTPASFWDSWRRLRADYDARIPA